MPHIHVILLRLHVFAFPGNIPFFRAPTTFAPLLTTQFCFQCSIRCHFHSKVSKTLHFLFKITPPTNLFFKPAFIHSCSILLLFTLTPPLILIEKNSHVAMLFNLLFNIVNINDVQCQTLTGINCL